jgi:cytochrome P450
LADIIPFPRPAGLPTPGSADWIQDICTDSAGALHTAYRQGGDLIAYENGPDLTLLAFGPRYNRAAMSDSDTFHNFGGAPGPRNSSQRRFCLGLFGLNGQRHLAHRRLLMPALRREAVEADLEPVTRVVEGHLARWRAGQVLDLGQEMKDLAFKVTGQILFGLDENPVEREIAHDFQQWLSAQYSVTLAGLLPVEPPPGSYEQLLEHGAALERHFRVLLRLRRSTLHHEQRDLLALLLHGQGEGRLSEDEVIGEMHTLVNAAYQTTASALTWTLLMVALHPEPANELVSELAEIADLPGSHSLLERVIKETLRLLPPVVFTFRRTTTSAPLGALTLPPGTMIILSPYLTHHMPAVFDQPQRFLPERWQTIAPSPYAYLPYGAGPRMCMGATFAQQMLRVAIASVVRRFRLSIVPGSRVDRRSDLVLSVRRRLPMALHVQDGRSVHTPIMGDLHEMVDLPFSGAARRAA